MPPEAVFGCLQEHDQKEQEEEECVSQPYDLSAPTSYDAWSIGEPHASAKLSAVHATTTGLYTHHQLTVHLTLSLLLLLMLSPQQEWCLPR
jgi:hypothetical protein